MPEYIKYMNNYSAYISIVFAQTSPPSPPFIRMELNEIGIVYISSLSIKSKTNILYISSISSKSFPSTKSSISLLICSFFLMSPSSRDSSLPRTIVIFLLIVPLICSISSTLFISLDLSLTDEFSLISYLAVHLGSLDLRVVVLIGLTGGPPLKPN